MRILLISNYFPPETEGGLEWSAYEAAMGLHERGHQVSVLTTVRKGGEVFEETAPFLVSRLLSYSFPAQYYGHRMRSIPRRITDAVSNARVGKNNLQLAKLGASYVEPDVVDIWGFSGISAAITLPFSKRGIPVVWHVGDLNLRERVFPHPFNRVLHGFVDPVWSSKERHVNHDHVVANSEFTRRLYIQRGFAPESVSVIYRGVSKELLASPAATKTSPPVILMACRVTVQKGAEVAVRALAEIPNAELHIAGVGEPDYVHSLERLIESTGVTSRVKLLGFLPKTDVLRRMREASIVLSASLIEEYFGRVNIEAMACRTPLVASDTENIKEIGEDGLHLLRYRQNEPSDLAEKANRILSDPKLAKMLIEQGFERVSTTFAQEKINDQIEAYLMKVVEARVRS